MDLDSTGLRQRRTGIKKIVEDLDIFEKVTDSVKEEKRTSSGIISFVCFTIIIILVSGELYHHFRGKKEYEYRFDVDTQMEEMPTLDIDMVIASACNNLVVMSSLDQSSGGLFAPSQESIKKDPTRFEFTDEEQLYWTVLRHAHAKINEEGLRGLEELQYIDEGVEDTLEHLADEKQEEEKKAIDEENRKNPKKSQDGNIVVMFGNGMGMFQVVASNGVDEGTACRVHGKFPVRKGKEEKITVSIGNGLGIGGMFAHMDGQAQKGNISHRIEKFNFGPRIQGLVAPLAGAEQISESGQNIYRYFIKIVPTKIFRGFFGGYTMAYQYSTTFLTKQLKEGEHSHGGILFEYEFTATVIEVREVINSFITLLLRLCSVVGGVYATSTIINTLLQLLLTLLSPSKPPPSPHTSVEEKVHLLDPNMRVH